MLAADAPDPALALDALLADYEGFQHEEFPLEATLDGDHRHGSRLGSVAPADFDRRAVVLRALLERARAIDGRRLGEREQVTREMLDRELGLRLDEHRFKAYLVPITNRWGFHVQFANLPDLVPLATLEDYTAYLARLEGFPAWVDDHIALMRKGMAEGITLPRVALEGIESSIDPHLVTDPAQSLLFKPFLRWPKSIRPELSKPITERARFAIEHSVIPGYRAFRAFLVDEYRPAARQTLAASALPQGRAWYESLVKRHTTLDVTPAEVHAKGLEEVARIEAEMAALLTRIGFRGGLQAYVEQLRKDPRYYATSADELLAKVALVLKRMDGKLPALFGKLPRTPYGIEPVPDFIAPRTTTAYYQPPAGDGTRAGTYFVNTYDLKSRPLYEVEALSLHEAVPGHHLQLALQQEMEGVPRFRRFARATAFVEGWAVYAESLGREVGFYTEPSSELGRLSYAMWRACRLVIDTGLHAMGWSREQAIAFLAERTALSRHNIESEVDRYIAWPGQALAYKMGELVMVRLRGEAQAALGPRFDLRAWHDMVLAEGATPLDVLERRSRAWVHERLASAGP